MKNHLFISFLTIALLFAACSANKNQSLSRALADIKNQRVTQKTINNLEAAKAVHGFEMESCYNLARIYQFNPSYKNLDKARLYYQQTLSFFRMPSMEAQMKKLKKDYGVDVASINKTVSDLDGLISNKAFSDCLKENTLSGYAKFVANYPNSSQVNAARNKALDLKRSENTIRGYYDYIKTFPGYRTDEVCLYALGAAKKKNTMDAYVDYISTMSDYIVNADQIDMPIYQNTKDYIAVYNSCIKYRSQNVIDLFNNRFLDEQSNYCYGNNQRIRNFCQSSPFPIEFNEQQKNKIVWLLRSIKVQDEVFFYITSGNGYILHDGNRIYSGDIKNGRREGTGREECDHGQWYVGGFSDNKFHGSGTYYYSDSHWESVSNWQYGVANGSTHEFFSIENKRNRKEYGDIMGQYKNGERDGKWVFKNTLETGGLLAHMTNLNQTYVDCDNVYYSNGKILREETVSQGLTNYYKRAENQAEFNESERKKHLSVNERNIMNYVWSISVEESSDVSIEYYVRFTDDSNGVIEYQTRKNQWGYHVVGYFGPNFRSVKPNSKEGALVGLYHSVHGVAKVK